MEAIYLNSCDNVNSFNDKIRNFIEIAGLGDPNLIEDLKKHNNWILMSIPVSCDVPENKPEIKYLNSENITVRIIRKKAIVTPCGLLNGQIISVKNLEGKITSGRKLAIDGLICGTISYTSDEDGQSVHSIQVNAPFSAPIVLPLVIEGEDVLNLKFQVITYLEDIHVVEVSERCVKQTLTLLLQAVPVRIECDDNQCKDLENISVKGMTERKEIEEINLSLFHSYNLWTEVTVSRNLIIPDKRPDIEQIDSILSCVDITSKVLADTPNSHEFKNHNGTKLTGKKLFLQGVIRQKISYTGSEAGGTSPLHSVHFDIPFSAAIAVKDYTKSFSLFRIEPYVEDIFVCAADSRKIYVSCLLFIKATNIEEFKGE